MKRRRMRFGKIRGISRDISDISLDFPPFARRANFRFPIGWEEEQISSLKLCHMWWKKLLLNFSWWQSSLRGYKFKQIFFALNTQPNSLPHYIHIKCRFKSICSQSLLLLFSFHSFIWNWVEKRDNNAMMVKKRII